MNNYCITAISCSCLLLGHLADAQVNHVDREHEVDVKDNKVSNVGDKAGKIDNNDAEGSAGSQKKINDTTVHLRSPYYIPPKNKLGTQYKFVVFEGSTERIDIETDPSAISPWILSNKERKLQFSATLTLTNAGAFPLQGEGNMIVPGKFAGKDPRLDIPREHWSAKVSGTVADLDIRETLYPDNRVGPGDDRTDLTARDKIVLWHIEGQDKVQFDIIKPPVHQDYIPPGTFQVRIEDLSGTNPGVLPQDFALVNDSKTFTFNVAHDSLNADISVKYGIDENNNNTLDDNEVVHEYLVHGVTPEDHSDAQSWLETHIEITLSGIADVLVRRLRYGTFPPIPNSYNPSNTTGTTPPLNAPRSLTHIFGTSTFINRGFESGLGHGREYFDVDAEFPIYRWNSNSDGSKLVLASDAFQKGIEKWLSELTHDQVAAAYSAAANNPADPSGVRRFVSFNDVKAKFNFGPGPSIGLGSASSTGGTLMVQIEPDGANYKIVAAHCTVGSIMVQDLFDYNYFKADEIGDAGDINRALSASVSAASIQCGFGKPGSVANAGQVGFVRIEVSGNVEITNITIKP